MNDTEEVFSIGEFSKPEIVFGCIIAMLIIANVFFWVWVIRHIFRRDKDEDNH